MAESIKVVCRVRPLNENEKLKDNNYCVSFPPDSANLIRLEKDKTYAFDNVFQPKTQQVEIYNTVAKPIVADVLNGYNGTIFAYGQTASGKTYTMEGVLGDSDLQGIIPRIVHDIFNHIYHMDENLEFHIKVSYFEIYLDKIRDLLDVSKSNLSVHEDKDRVPYVKGATERFVSTPAEVFDIIDEGKVNRHVSVTNMNEHSSRSHSIFMITVRQENLETQKKLHGKLYLVDLAGSEKVAKTGAEGSTLTEAMNINKSLSALGNVINALVDNHAHVPYRDSKLTRILQESLGGNAKTTMVICVSPSSYNESETKSTLLFGMRAKTIKNIVTVNEELTADEWRRRYERLQAKARRMKEIITRLEAELKRWRAGESVSSTEWIVAMELELEEEAAADGVALDTPTGAPSVPFTTETTPSGAPTGRPIHLSASGAGAPAGVSEEQLHALYQQLDDKDDDINKHTQTIARLRQQLEEQEEMLRTARLEAETSLADVAQLQAECQSSKEEAKDILQALEELALSHDQREAELAVRDREIEEIKEQLAQTSLIINGKESEVQLARDTLAAQRKKYAEILGALVRDVLDVGECMSNQLQKPNVNVGERLDEEATVMRLYMNKMRTEAKMLHSRVNQLEEERVQNVQLLRKSEDEAKEYAIRVRELETKVQSLTDKVDDSDSRKRQLQDLVDNLNADVAKLRANEQLLAGSGSTNKEILAGQSEIRVKLDEEFKRQSEQYAQQVKHLRDELETKEKKFEELKDELNHVKLQYEKSTEESSALKKQLETATLRLEAVEKEETRREQSKQDLRALEETMLKEFNTLATLRRLFVEDLKNRIKKSTSRMNAAKAAEAAAAHQEGENTEVAGLKELIGEEEEDESSQWGSLAQREKISFLENNLAKLTKVHKQLIHDNAELRCELPKLEKRLRSTVERVRSLEMSLKEAKEGALRDRKRYQHEVDRIKEAVRRRQTGRFGNPSAMIAKPIRAGHAPSAVVCGGGGGGANVRSS
ncbi:Kinesin heavy chain [Echinococcus granulosus]|uniref:Kinesin-like protein n=1 Tax=Echinococcus granulosus TaxID=6210 RepID=U6J6Z7_ECHGR|nr:Kinesin heavy chain [Echinococcus granulosus]EUB62238.1 Kinesin heavy chain [Echinococcus granulosus]KAH9282860.1 Kinesin heavy chain [Echinococcus granulosus]CDS17492.1 kinesin heavy chain [Echinococcus granulosus]